MQKGIREGTIRNIDPPLLFLLMASSISGLIARAHTVHDPAEREEIVSAGLDFIRNGIKRNAERNVTRPMHPAVQERYR